MSAFGGRPPGGDRSGLERLQERRLSALLREVAKSNPFYRHKLDVTGSGKGLEQFASRDRFFELPFTTKNELVADQDQNPPFGSNLTYPLEQYVRCHQTSGTSGRPLRWLDTAESWRVYLECWQKVFESAGVSASDRVFVAFSFGPFIGFWGAFEAAQSAGALTLTGGGLSSSQRLDQILETDATVLVSTPTYALHLAEVARERGLDLPRSAVRLSIHAGEPGASVPAVRERLESLWGARCWDHAGATELGAWGYPRAAGGLYLHEPWFLAEVIDPETSGDLESTSEGARGELVLTSLGRVGSPLLRYRTGDLVELHASGGDDPRRYLEGGVLARVDDMLVIRGVNVYPAAIENLVRADPAILEFRARVRRGTSLTELEIEIEVDGDDARTERARRELGERLRRGLSLRVPVSTVAVGSLPRFELKAQRFVSDD